jgi:CRP/FNR family transcriptional regulator, cyclic AMP receptor protein
MVSIEFLKTHSLFGGITDDELIKIRKLMKEINYPAGTIIIREHERGDCLYFIHEGSVEVLKEAPLSGEEHVLEKVAEFGAGDTFGEMELIDIQPRSATVRAITDTTVLTLSNMDLYKIEQEDLKTFTLIIMNLAREISRRLRKMGAMVASSLFTEEKEHQSHHPGAHIENL